MDRKTHTIFAPIFTFGLTYLGYKSNLIPISSGISNAIKPVLFVAIPPIISLFTCMIPDTDHHAYRPLKWIWAEKKVVYKDKGKMKVYNPPKRRMDRYYASFFHITGVKYHRHFMSHSPLIWLLYFIILYIPIFILNKINLALIADILRVIYIGATLGIISHLIGDMFTLNGLPLLPKANFKPMKILFGKIPILNKLPKATNKLWAMIFLSFSLYILMSILFPSAIKNLNSFIGNGISGIFFKLIGSKVKEDGIFKFISDIIFSILNIIKAAVNLIFNIK